MRLTGKEDIGLPQDEAFAAVTDVAFIERQLLRRGIDILRVDEAAELGPGARWTAEAEWNGRHLPLAFEVSEWLPPDRVVLLARSNGLSGDLRIELAALSRQDTRVRAILSLQADGFRDRLFLNSLMLARSRISRKFSDLVTHFVRGVETRAARA